MNHLKSMMLAMLALMALNASAANVDATAARAMALQFVSSRPAGRLMSPAADLQLIHAEPSSVDPKAVDYYVFNLDDGSSFVIVSGDDRAEGVLAYGDRAIADYNSLPGNMLWFLGRYKEQIEYLQRNPDLQVTRGSDVLKGSTPGTASVAPLLGGNKWGQNYPYNEFAPLVGSQHALSGCVATAMAQVMWYWQYPAVLPALPSYTTRTLRLRVPALPGTALDWDNMLDEYYGVDYPAAQADAVATLMRYCGQICWMDYDLVTGVKGGSAAWCEDQLGGLRLFGYTSAGMVKRNDYSLEEWNAMIQEDLSAGRPLLYSGQDLVGGSGHAFVVDGYDADNGMFHINWGWDGGGNGYCAMDAFNVKKYEFNGDMDMHYHVCPGPPVTPTGDLNVDGEVNIADVNAVIDIILGGKPAANGDVNGDGEVNIGDVNAVIDIIMRGGCNPYPEAVKFTANNVSFKMMPVEGGTFTMGDEGDGPAHDVTLSGYYIGQAEVTQMLWRAVMNNGPSTYWGDLNRPVENVSWDDCQTFIEKLNKLTSQTFRLPTEAEWEFAARGGNKGQGCQYAGGNSIGDVAWYGGNSDGVTNQVGLKVPNELGLFDMSGNVNEWCQDWFGPYGSEAQTDPTGPDTGEARVWRGGSWDDGERECRVTSRNACPTDSSDSCLGLRLALTVIEPDPSAMPVITTAVDENAVTVTATGEGTVQLYVNGQAVGNPYTAARAEETYTITAQAAALEEGKRLTWSEEQAIAVPALRIQDIHVNGVTFMMVPVEGGTFTMGATDEQADYAASNESPAHQVTLTSNYYIGQTEVTQALWQAVMGTSPSYFAGDPQRPVEQVSWDDCQTFITRLNALTGKHFRLPTEAEWEFAARGGNKGHGYTYAGGDSPDGVAWYWDNLPSQDSRDDGYGTQPVGTRAPNELELFDMSGNVMEWCQDRYGNYPSADQTDPKGPNSGTNRVFRGGCWNENAQCCRVSWRNGKSQKFFTEEYLGFRLAL